MLVVGVERNFFPYCFSNFVTNGQKSIIAIVKSPFIKGPTSKGSFEIG